MNEVIFIERKIFLKMQAIGLYEEEINELKEGIKHLKKRLNLLKLQERPDQVLSSVA